MTASPLIAVDGVRHAFGRAEVLAGVSLVVHPGEIVLLTGPSGSGKTTLLTLIGGLRPVQAGSIRVLGTDLRGASSGARAALRRRLGYIFQLHNLLGALTACQNVLQGLAGAEGLDRIEARRRAREMLAAVGLEHAADRRPHELSAGQRQRVAVARALVGMPSVVLADEPTASLDRQSGREVADCLRTLTKERGAAVVLVSHDDRVFDVADRIVRLEDGRLAGTDRVALAS